jgi:hypothetical protein
VPTTRAARETRATVKRIVFVSGLITGRKSTQQSGGLLYRAEQHCVPLPAFSPMETRARAGTRADADMGECACAGVSGKPTNEWSVQRVSAVDGHRRRRR